MFAAVPAVAEGAENEPTVTANIPTNFIVGEEKTLTVTTNGTYTNDNVKGKVTISGGTNYKLYYYENQSKTWIEFSGYFGPSSGFPFTDGITSSFKAVFSEAGEYNVKIEIVNATDDSEVCNMTVTVNVKVDTSNMSTLLVGDTSSVGTTVYPEDQIIQVIEGQDWTIVAGSVVTINGQLVVPEGSKVIIEDGGKLIINGKVASEIDGVVTLESDMNGTADSDNNFGGVFKIGAKSVVNFNADVEINGTLLVSESGTANFNANVTIATEGKIAAGVTEVVKVSDVSVMKVYGAMDVAKIKNYGAVVIDSEVASGSSTISLLKSGAYVDVVNFTVDATSDATLTINDDGLVIKNVTEESAYVNVNSVTIDPSNKAGYTATAGDTITVSGLKVTESAVAKNVKGSTAQKYIDNQMDISGELKTSAYTENELNEGQYFIGTATVDTGEGTISTVTGDLTIGANVTVNNGGEMTVTGKVTANIAPNTTSNDDGSVFSTSSGEKAQLILKDSGLVQVVTKALENADDIEATLYETSVTSGSTTTKYQNYVTIDTALDNANADTGIKKLDVLQNQKVLKDNTVPANITLTVKYGLTVGDDKDNTDVTLTVSKDVKKVDITENIKVNGTLYVENNSKVEEDKVTSDVRSQELNAKGLPAPKGWAKYTNLHTAMEEANAGETITVSTTALDVKKNLTVKDGVTLAIPAGVTAKIYEGVTVTVNGYIVTDSEISTGNTKSTTTTPVVTVFGKTASTVENKAAIALGPNGYIASSVQDISFIAVETATEGSQNFAKLPVAGAFYDAEIDDAQYNVLSSLEVALGMKDKITGTITLDGKVTAGDVSFAAADEDTCKSITLGANADVVFQSLTLDGTSLIATNGDFSGPVTVAGVTVSFTHVNGFTVEDTDDAMKFTANDPNAGFTSAATGSEKASVTLTAGTMKATIGSNAVKFVVGAGATLEATEDLVTFNELVIDGTVSVPSKALLTGTTTTINENGVLSVAPLTATTDKGTFTVTTFNVGIVGEDYFGIPAGNSSGSDVAAAASVSGPVTLGTDGTAYVAAGVVIADGTFPTATKSTALYIGDELWMTVYTLNSSMTFDNIVPNGDENPVENGEFLDWVDEDGESLTSTTPTSDDAKPIGSVDKAIAKINYVVYEVSILNAEGVIDISIDGNLLRYSDIGYGTTLTAGTHKVEYTLDNGWTGTATLAVNGTIPEGMDCTIDGTNFTISGDFDGALVLQLTGIEKSGFVPDAPDSGDNGGMTITDYLLIILVVLIVVMAIIVAMRLMRS